MKNDIIYANFVLRGMLIMEMRNIDKLGVSTSLLGFGCMRFPTLENGEIDRELSVKMLDMAFERGVNYYDTAYPYHNGESELFLGEYLNGKERESYFLATKLPVWQIDCVEDARKMFETQLSRLQKDYIDFYLLHAMDRERFEKMRDLGVIDFCEELKAQGRIRFLGFSFHDDYEVFEEMINYKDWDFCQIQYNYMDVNEQAGDKGYKLTVEKNVPLVIMEPVKGGSLANLPEEIRDILGTPDNSTASFALRFVASRPNVKVVLSGMSTMEQVEDNLNTFSNFTPLSEEEEQNIVKVREALNNRVRNGCTGCNYCMPCPKGVDIPKNFRIWNKYNVYGNLDELRNNVRNIQNDGKWAEACVSCGLCETKCPQRILIRDNLKTLVKEINNVL